MGRRGEERLGCLNAPRKLVLSEKHVFKFFFSSLRTVIVSLYNSFFSITSYILTIASSTLNLKRGFFYRWQLLLLHETGTDRSVRPNNSGIFLFIILEFLCTLFCKCNLN